jgi:hypothetical protein
MTDFLVDHTPGISLFPPSLPGESQADYNRRITTCCQRNPIPIDLHAAGVLYNIDGVPSPSAGRGEIRIPPGSVLNASAYFPHAAKPGDSKEQGPISPSPVSLDGWAVMLGYSASRQYAGTVLIWER